MKNQLTKLHKQCLVDMPMLIDVMAETINQMHAILGDYYEDYCSLLNNHFIPKSKAKYDVVPNDWVVECFERMPLERSVYVGYTIELCEKKARNPHTFVIEIAYNLDEKEHAIYFLIEDQSKEIDLSGLISDLQSTDEYLYSIEPTRLYVEISVDETLSDEKIHKCSELFKDKILYPIITTLK